MQCRISENGINTFVERVSIYLYPRVYPSTGKLEMRQLHRKLDYMEKHKNKGFISRRVD